MNPAVLNAVITLLGVLAIVVIIALIWYVIWRALTVPIKMKDDIFAARDNARQELLQIQAAKSVEWDKYKELQDETDKLRKAYFGSKETIEKLNDEIAKLKVAKDNLINYNKKLKETKEPKQPKKS